MQKKQDEVYMQMALQLAEKGRGKTAPNPMVGAVIVKNGRVIGSGFHEYCGGPHAEVNAVANATESVQGATIYVTLEPCAHYGKTPPCTELLLAQKPKRVVVGCLDPNPLVAGKGLLQLEQAGIETVSGILEDECRYLNRVFFHYITARRPYVVLKTAMTLDGKTATATGESQWISGEQARLDVHRLRSQYTGVMTGIGTILQDDARLTCRIPGGKNPIRIVTDSRLRISPDANVLKEQQQNQTIVAAVEGANAAAAQRLERLGVRVLYCGCGDRVDLNDLMEKLGALGVDSILLEGGATLNEAALRAGIVQEVVVYIAPKMVGGNSAATSVGGIGVAHLRQAYRLERMQTAFVGEDIKITALVRGTGE